MNRGAATYANSTYAHQAVAWLELLGVSDGVVYDSESSGVSTAELDLAAEYVDSLGVSLEHLGQLCLDGGTRCWLLAWVDNIYDLHNFSYNSKCECLVDVLPSCWDETSAETRTRVRLTCALSCMPPTHHLAAVQQTVAHVLARADSDLFSHGKVSSDRCVARHSVRYSLADAHRRRYILLLISLRPTDKIGSEVRLKTAQEDTLTPYTYAKLHIPQYLGRAWFALLPLSYHRTVVSGRQIGAPNYPNL